jgi:hypothetical protein
MIRFLDFCEVCHWFEAYIYLVLVRYRMLHGGCPVLHQHRSNYRVVDCTYFCSVPCPTLRAKRILSGDFKHAVLDRLSFIRSNTS